MQTASTIDISYKCPDLPSVQENDPSVTLTRVFFTTWVGIPRGFLWTRNCVVTFGLAIAGFLWTRNCMVPLDSQLRGYLWTRNCGVSLDSQLHGSFGLAVAWLPGLGMLWRPRPCFAASHWTVLYSWCYIPGSILLVLSFWLCIAGFIFQVSDYWFYIPGFTFLGWECFGGLGLASRPRIGLFYIPGFIFLILY